MAEGTIRGALRTHDREPPSRHCGTGIAPDRDILANWRDLNEPGASLPAVPPGRARAPRGNCRLFDTGKRNPARDGLFAGGSWIRTVGSARDRLRFKALSLADLSSHQDRRSAKRSRPPARANHRLARRELRRGRAVTPSGTRGVRNDALSIYFEDATRASAFVARWCVGAKVETAGGVFQVRKDAPEP